jgi:hypothetical protein
MLIDSRVSFKFVKTLEIMELAAWNSTKMVFPLCYFSSQISSMGIQCFDEIVIGTAEPAEMFPSDRVGLPRGQVYRDVCILVSSSRQQTN